MILKILDTRGNTKLIVSGFSGAIANRGNTRIFFGRQDNAGFRQDVNVPWNTFVSEIEKFSEAFRDRGSRVERILELRETS